ncbi:MAG: manganese efflux pump [Oscillospiraceae bacterium]|nr:manganese efflux pump [Oscillospiraceae bacterium]
MTYSEILLIGLGLSMDAFAVSVTDGLCEARQRRKLLAAALCFGFFQGLMPVIGYAAGMVFERSISAFDHWVALVLLGFIGGKMLLDAPRQEAPEEVLTGRTIILQGIAVSIDALAVGVSFAALPDVRILPAACIILAETFALSCIGSLLGKTAGRRLGSHAQIIGGVLLIGIGCKIFVEHVFF